MTLELQCCALVRLQFIQTPWILESWTSSSYNTYLKLSIRKTMIEASVEALSNQSRHRPIYIQPLEGLRVMVNV